MARRGISPVIATVIIVAVAIAIAVAVAAWVMGLYGHYTQYESVQVLPSTSLRAGNGSAILHLCLKNGGSATAHVYGVELAGSSVNVSITLQPGAIACQDITFNVSVIPGAVYQVAVYTKAGNTAYYTLTAG
ncbi:MAG: hypothetical protein GSR77_00300 [Desulfurococcales archaeon]|nr:hypothetical protein [Desulfurococcales archaeon]